MTALLFCFHLTLAQLRSSDGCRAELQGPEGQICFSEQSWIRILEERKTASCFSLSGKWKVSTPLDNEFLRSKKGENQFRVQDVMSQGRSPSLFIRWVAWLDLQRFEISQTLKSHSIGIARALLLGEHLPAGVESFLRGMGMIHLLSANGMHFYLLALLVDFFALRCCVWLKFPSRFFPWIRSGILLPLGMYAWMLSGFKVSILRIFVLLSLRGVAKLFGFKWNWGVPILSALGIASLYSGSFSGLASASLIGAGVLFAGEGSWRLALGANAIASMIGIWGTSLISIFAPLLSLIFLVIVGCIFYPAFLLSSLFHANAELEFLSVTLDRITEWILRFQLKIPSLWIVHGQVVLLGLILSAVFLSVAHALRARGKFFLKMSALGLTSILAAQAIAANHPQMQPRDAIAQSVEQIDVGQGDSALILSPPNAGLIDSGSEKNISAMGWIKLFSGKNVNRLQWIALTHLDQDHSGGVRELARLIPIDCVVAPEAELESPRGLEYSKALQELGIHVQNWNSGCIPYPAHTQASSGTAHGNQNMGAILVPIKNGFYFNAGDAEHESEIELGKWAASLPELRGERRILKISHHGSNTSSEPDFLASIHPTEAWISVGAGNRYGHPALVTLGRLENLGIPVRRTDEEGAIESDQASSSF